MEHEVQSQLQLNDNVKVTDDGSPILGVLEGPCADFMAATRNGRKYDKELWEKVFKDPIVNELIDNGGIPGELDHPADRTETCSEKIAILMKEKPVKKNGTLWAKFHILNTPCGKIAYTLAKAGFKLGISSRGSGEVYTGNDGQEHVDADSYEFVGFDLVLIPAVKSARLNLITESLNKGNSKIELNEAVKSALIESLDDATEEDRCIMLETLHNLNIDFSGDFVADDDIEVDSVNTDAADVDGDKVVNDLKRVLIENRDLTRQVKELQEKLSVCYAKDAKYGDSAEESKRQIDTLKRSLDAKNSEVEKLHEQVDMRNQLIAKMKVQNEGLSRSKTTLNESVASKDTAIANLKQNVALLEKKLADKTSATDKKCASLNESLQELQKDTAIKRNEYSQKIEGLTRNCEKWKSVAQTAVDKYIGLRANLLGVSPVEIKSKLSESYSFNDIDRVCDSLKTYKLGVNSLPFDTTQKNVKMRVSESVKPTSPVVANQWDDDVDDSLAGLAKIKLS